MSQIDYVRREECFAAVESMARRRRVPWDRRCRVDRRKADPRSLVGSGNPRGYRRGGQHSHLVAAQPLLVSLDDSISFVHNHAQAADDRAQPKGGAPQ